MLKGIVGIHADIVTVSDQDILFKQNWQSATFDVFNSFPKAGVVGVIQVLDTWFPLIKKVYSIFWIPPTQMIC